MKSLWAAIGTLVLVTLATGCRSYERAWKSALATPTPTTTIEGPWIGQWESDHNHHHGPLRCILKHVTNSVYSAAFKAGYGIGIFKLTFGYTANFQGEKDETPFVFQGDANLGWYAGGVYHYSGRIVPTNFSCIYTSKYDFGVFRLERPVATPPKS